MSTTLKLTNEYGTITIETNEDVAGIDNFINCLVRPILKAVGYQDVTVNAYIGDFEDTSSRTISNLAKFFEEYRKLDDGGVTSSPDYDTTPSEEDAYEDIYDAPVVSTKTSYCTHRIFPSYDYTFCVAECAVMACGRHVRKYSFGSHRTSMVDFSTDCADYIPIKEVTK